MLNCQFFICASKGPVIIMNQLKSIYNSQSKIYIHIPFTPIFQWLLLVILDFRLSLSLCCRATVNVGSTTHVLAPTVTAESTANYTGVEEF